MSAFASRIGHWPLALTLVVGAACADDTSPSTESLRETHHIAAGNGVIAEAALNVEDPIDFTTVSLTLDVNAYLDAGLEAPLVTGTVKCSRPEEIAIHVQIEQEQEDGQTSTVVRGSGGAEVNCSNAVRQWMIVVSPWNAAFMAGHAAISARTNDTGTWIKPAFVQRPVRIRE